MLGVHRHDRDVDNHVDEHDRRKPSYSAEPVEGQRSRGRRHQFLLPETWRERRRRQNRAIPDFDQTLVMCGPYSNQPWIDVKASEFSANSPGRLLSTEGDGLAFVPDPLPDRLQLDSAVTHLLAAAEHATGRLSGVASRLMNPYLVGSPLLYREAILSSRIEGTVTSPEQLVLLDTAAPTDSPEQLADTREVRNYVRAMEHGLASQLPLSKRLVQELHGVLMDGVRGGRERPGEFRTIQNFVGRGSDTLATARFVPPPVPEMHECLNALEARIHRDDDELPYLVKVALAHYQFEAIHPFRDGNGRVGRLLIPLMLVRVERLSQPVLYLSAYLERNRQEYMDLLLSVSREGAWLQWVAFFLRGVEESATESINQAFGLLKLRDDYHDRLRDSRSFGQLQQLVDDLFMMPSTTIASAANKLGISLTTASSYIDKLVKVGVLHESTGRRWSRAFIAPGILAFMHNRVE
jgi:Fic family protein